jgi:flagellar basal-body rod protein FlgF
VGLEGGGRAYTRDGRLSLDAERRLVLNGRPVLDRSGAAITLPPGTTATIAPDGSVRAGDATVGELALYRLEGAVARAGSSLLVPGRGGRAEPVQAGLRSGEVELGNAAPLEGMVQLIAAQRNFESSMQALQTYRNMDNRSSEIGRVR